MRVLVTGGQGMLGRDLVPLLSAAGHELRTPTHAEVALEQKGALTAWLDGWTPQRIYHLAAYTDVDGCEKDPERARLSNVVAAENVSVYAFRHDAELVDLSTDYVFDGSATSPIPPEAHPAPLNVYGSTKAQGEDAVRRTVKRHWIVRVSWLAGPHGRNFIQAIQSRIAAGQPLTVVTDQRGCPTFTFDAAPALVRLPDVAAPGTYHLANTGECTWYDLAAEIVRLAGAGTPIKRTTTCELNRPALRPAYSVLDCSKTVAALGAPLPPWQESLIRYEERARAARNATHV
jgi:dTDP-4-dehydrorhamnose reductase